MEHETAKNLSKSKDIQEFTDFVLDEMNKLNTVTDVQMGANSDFNDIGMQVIARRLAYDKLKEILEPLLDISEDKVAFKKNEFIT